MTMDDLRTRFADLDAIVMPDLWTDIERRATSQATEAVRPQTTWRGPSGRRAISPTMLAVIAGLMAVAVGGGILIGSWIERPTPSVVGSHAPTTTVLGCILRQGLMFQEDRSVGAPECEFVAAQAVEYLSGGRGTPFSILLRFHTCPDLCWPLDGATDPPAGPRIGAATIEYADAAEPIELTIRGSLDAPAFEIVDRTWSGPREPASPRVEGSGPFSFTLGHCGLDWFVDFDGSFWVPVDLIDGRASALINAEQGEMLLLSPDRVQFRGESGFTANLARFPGPKYVWICL
jgi:hypothetical protein